MSKSTNWIAKACVLAAMITVGSAAIASVQDASIVIDHALNSPTLTIRYSGAHVAMVELRLNGVSYATRTTDVGQSKGETNFTLDASSLSNGDNDVDVRLYDKNGKLVGAEHSTVVSDDGRKAPVFLEMPKMGATVQGPVQISLGFGKDLKNVYVSFFVDNQFKAMSNTPPFNYIWDTSHDSNGWHDLEAWVVDDSSSTFKTRRIKVFVNNPGGLTTRQFNQPAPTPVAAVIPVVATPPAPKAAPLSLQTSVPTPTASLQSASAGAKAAGTAAVAAAARANHSLAPTLVTRAPAPKHVAISEMGNTVKPTVGGSAGIKGVSLGSSVSSGPRVLLPTGKRVATEGQPALSGPIGPTKARSTKEMPMPASAKMSALPKVEATLAVPSVPKPAPAKISNSTISVTVANPKPVSQPRPAQLGTSLNSQPAMEPSLAVQPKLATLTRPKIEVKPSATVRIAKAVRTAVTVRTTATVRTAVAVHPATAPQKASTKAVSKAIAAASAVKLVAIGHGAKLPNVGTYSISLNAKPVQFDAVKPRVKNNVPLTPFRYLFEQSGGKVDWANKTKSVTANGEGKEIYIRIGDKLAKVNNLPVQLDLTPFIENGRTIVPLSFIQDALDVEVDYDPVTNHVLITSIKKKH